MEFQTVTLGTAPTRTVTVGASRAAIICPLQGPDNSTLVSSARTIAASPCDIVEWRVDTFASTQENVLRGALQVLRRELTVPLVATARSHSEGGGTAPENYSTIVRALIDAGVDAVDIEMSAPAAVDLIDYALARHTPVILSSHDFVGTAGIEQLLDQFTRMQHTLRERITRATQTKSAETIAEWESRGWGIVKIATTPQNSMDVFKLMVAARRFVDTVATLPIIAIAMGRLGQVSRAYPQTLGSSATFASVPGESSAPGQISIDALARFDESTHCLQAPF
ncbi:MAG: type I 3-dehydroquinate dehydratase [Actinomycetaceae bacterium]|nr:type I 3-dehydroquinate dehydratase [Actinomycetaceae bacterium]